MLLFAGASDFPAYNNGVHRVDDSTPGAEVDRARRRSSSRRAGAASRSWVRDTGEDDDLAGGGRRRADRRVRRLAADDLPGRGSPEVPLPDGVEIRMVTDARRRRRTTPTSSAPAYVSLGAPEDATRSHFSGPNALLTAPHVHSAVAYLDGAPVSCAQILVSHGIAGVYWVGSLEAARGRGIAEAVTRHVTNLGFDLGAANVQLQASPMGEPIYRRMGYEDLHRREFRLAAPTHLGRRARVVDQRRPASSGRRSVRGRHLDHGPAQGAEAVAASASRVAAGGAGVPPVAVVLDARPCAPGYARSSSRDQPSADPHRVLADRSSKAGTLEHCDVRSSQPLSVVPRSRRSRTLRRRDEPARPVPSRASARQRSWPTVKSRRRSPDPIASSSVSSSSTRPGRSRSAAAT